MLVQDPSKGNDVDVIFDHQARQLGAMQGTLENLQPSSGPRSFAGTVRLLSGESVPSAPLQPKSIVHNIVFWRNDFTVNGWPSEESIRKSECPKELEPAGRRSSVHVNLIRRDEECHEPEKRHTPFQGVGRTIGSSSASESVPEADVSSSLNTAPSPSMGMVVDKSLPSTSIQLRLADGTRMVSHFNYHHTIGHICSFIDASRPDGTRTYQLQTVEFPPKVLTDPTQTIEQAGLLNSVVIQKL